MHGEQELHVVANDASVPAKLHNDQEHDELQQAAAVPVERHFLHRPVPDHLHVRSAV